MKKLFHIFFLGLALSCGMAGCSKDNGSTEPALPDTEELTEDQDELVAGSIDTVQFASSAIVLPNGERLNSFMQRVDPNFHQAWRHRGTGSAATACVGYSPDPAVYGGLGAYTAKYLLLSRLLEVGGYLTTRTKLSNGQSGFAYSFGSADPCALRVAPGSPTSKCQEPVYGVDCSGMISAMFESAGVTISGNAATLHKPSTIANAIKAAIPSFCKAKVEELTQENVPLSELQSGDIIYWTQIPVRNKKTRMLEPKSASHIGIILENANGKKASYQSNGTYKYPCSTNKDSKHGPSIIDLSDNTWFNSPLTKYTITRINVNISGSWEYRLACIGASSEILKLNLDFPADAGRSWTLSSQRARDYTGEILSLDFSFTYDPITYMLNGTVYTGTPGTAKHRIDRFTLSLDSDDSDYVPMTRVLVNNGCPGAARLINRARCQ